MLINYCLIHSVRRIAVAINFDKLKKINKNKSALAYADSYLILTMLRYFNGDNDF